MVSFQLIFISSGCGDRLIILFCWTELLGELLERERRDRLPQPHVVGEDAAGAERGEELEPREAAALVGAERRAYVAHNLSRTDPLTGLLNARGWDEVLGAESARCERHGHGAGVRSMRSGRAST